MIDRTRFVAQGTPRWQELEKVLGQPRSQDGAEVARFAALHREVVSDLAVARSHDLPRDLVAYLGNLCGRSHDRLYGARERRRLGLGRLLLAEFPAALRANLPFFVVASLVFWVPFFGGMAGAASHAPFAEAVLGAGQIEALRTLWASDLDRGADGDHMMTGFYVLNNVGIALRCFAMGVTAGLGSLWVLLSNGLILGASFGVVLTSEGRGPFLEFTSGHGAWELTAITVAGAAGLKLGWTLLAPGRRSRADALADEAPTLALLVLGFVAMLVLAALIEGLWSGGPIPRPVKFVFGAVQWAVVGVWLSFGGRGQAAVAEVAP